MTQSTHLPSRHRDMPWKAWVHLATTADITLSGTQTIDGVGADAGFRVLVKDQTDLSENGIYVVRAGAWERAYDMDTGTEVIGAFVFVILGGQALSLWYCDVTAFTVTVGTSSITFTEFTGGGAGGQWTTDGTTARLAAGLFALAQEDDGTTVGQIDMAGGWVDTLATERIGLFPNEGNPGGSSVARVYMAGGHGVVIPILSADPSGANSDAAQLYYNDVSNTVRWYNGSAWADLGVGGALALAPEVPTGTVDGVNDTFTLSAAPAGLILVKEGLVQREGSGNDYVLSGSTITYEAGNLPLTGESHVAYLTTGPGYSEGTSFPGSPATDDKFYRTDRNLLYYFDGTRWLTTQLFEDTFSGTLTGYSATGGIGRFAPLNSTDLWLVDFRWTYQVVSAHTATTYWEIRVRKFDNTTNAVVVTLTSDKATTTWNNPAPTAIGALLGTANDLIFYEVTKVSTPGNINVACALRYRLVG